jgi:hypothetical protein
MTTAAEKQADEQLAIALEFAELEMTLPEMADWISLEAHLIEGSERARLIGGLAEEPDPDQVGRIARFLFIMRYLQKLHEKPDAAARHFDKIARARNERR